MKIILHDVLAMPLTDPHAALTLALSRGERGLAGEGVGTTMGKTI